MRVTILLLLFMVGCIGDGGEPSQPGREVLPAPSVVIANFSFSPQDLNITRGQTVTWINQDGVVHHVSGEAGGFDSERLASNGRYEHTFEHKGQYPYRCLIHSGMVGTIHVA